MIVALGSNRRVKSTWPRRVSVGQPDRHFCADSSSVLGRPGMTTWRGRRRPRTQPRKVTPASGDRSSTGTREESCPPHLPKYFRQDTETDGMQETRMQPRRVHGHSAECLKEVPLPHTAATVEGAGRGRQVVPIWRCPADIAGGKGWSHERYLPDRNPIASGLRASTARSWASQRASASSLALKTFSCCTATHPAPAAKTRLTASESCRPVARPRASTTASAEYRDRLGGSRA